MKKINPYSQIFEKVIALSKEQGYDTFDYLPDEQQSYPFVFIGNQQNQDIETKDRTLGITHLQIDVYAEFNRRNEVSTILDNLQQVIAGTVSTTDYYYQVLHGTSQLLPDSTTDVPLWHGILELDIQYY